MSFNVQKLRDVLMTGSISRRVLIGLILFLQLRRIDLISRGFEETRGTTYDHRRACLTDSHLALRFVIY